MRISYRRLLRCNITTEEDNDTLPSSSFFQTQRKKQHEQAIIACHCLLHCNTTREEGDVSKLLLPFSLEHHHIRRQRCIAIVFFFFSNIEKKVTTSSFQT
jgi:hypothetical protein